MPGLWVVLRLLLCLSLLSDAGMVTTGDGAEKGLRGIRGRMQELRRMKEIESREGKRSPGMRPKTKRDGLRAITCIYEKRRNGQENEAMFRNRKDLASVRRSFPD